MKVQCIYCRKEIELNRDSEETRAAGTDPHQQLRVHMLRSHSLAVLTSHTRALAWLIDGLAFIPVECNLADNKYRAHLIAMIDYFQSPEWMEERRSAPHV